MKYSIFGEAYDVVDALSDISVTDSSVCTKNKIGSGNGERKVYVGNESKKLLDFFGQFSEVLECILLKKDLLKYLEMAQKEYKNPTQEYREKPQMPQRYNDLLKKVATLNDVIKFNLIRSKVKPPRVYLNSLGSRTEQRKSSWLLLGEIALPRVSNISFMKLIRNGRYIYYMKLEYDGISLRDESDLINKDEEKIMKGQLAPAEKETLILARIGQGKYRKNLLKEMNWCPFTLIDDEHLLVASHIKPWSVSNNIEKKDPKNGFLFSPTYDKLFDRGYITFTDQKVLEISPWLSVANANRLKLKENMVVTALPVIDDKRKKYLEYHRGHVFKH